jgi:hypothetical protein
MVARGEGDWKRGRRGSSGGSWGRQHTGYFELALERGAYSVCIRHRSQRGAPSQVLHVINKSEGTTLQASQCVAFPGLRFSAEGLANGFILK